jgi:sulfoxide reductase heme-binding subunit YedZ
VRGAWLLAGWVKPALWAALAAPALWLVAAAATDRLGANPAEALLRGTGEWALRFLCLTLAVTPLRVIARLPTLLRLRRSLGLATFAYAALHVLAWGWLDQGFVVADMLRDIAKRPFILVGTLAFVLMLPLALTSSNAAVRRLGARRWQALHRAVYAVAGTALLHFFWMRAAKQRWGEVAVYAAVIGLLLGWRLWHRARNPG